MKYYRQPVKGIDQNIQRMQDELHDKLLLYFDLPDDQYQCFGRAHKVPKAIGYDPYVYMSDGNYKPVKPDDRYAAISFFGLGDNTKVSGPDNITQVHLIFFVHLGKIAPKIGDVRADLEAREVVQAIMGQNLFGFTLTEVITGVQSVFQGYNVGRFTANQTQEQGKRGEEFTDMHPFHVFRINGTLRYDKPHLI